MDNITNLDLKYLSKNYYIKNIEKNYNFQNDCSYTDVFNYLITNKKNIMKTTKELINTFIDNSYNINNILNETNDNSKFKILLFEYLLQLIKYQKLEELKLLIINDLSNCSNYKYVDNKINMDISNSSYNKHIYKSYRKSSNLDSFILRKNKQNTIILPKKR